MESEIQDISDAELILEFKDRVTMAKRIKELENVVKELSVNLNTCKNDYWLMSNLLEHYSTDKEQGVKDCIERMRFREPLFKCLEKHRELIEGIRSEE